MKYIPILLALICVPAYADLADQVDSLMVFEPLRRAAREREMIDLQEEAIQLQRERNWNMEVQQMETDLYRFNRQLDMDEMYDY